MLRTIHGEKILLFSYFLFVIGLGTGLLSIPMAWGGDGPLSLIDAFFTAVSAVCVTGLITVDTAQYTIFGKTVIMGLIQAGGLGIITFTTIFLALPRRRLSFHSMKIVKGYYIDTVEFRAGHIVRNIVLMAFAFEAAGAAALHYSFRITDHSSTLFNAAFHSISAFCNAGFSLYSDSLESHILNPWVSVSTMLLIVLGGLGFVVLHDIRRRWRLKSPQRLSIHTKVVLTATVVLIVAGALIYFLLERNGVLAGLSPAKAAIAAVFQSVTTRTAGFNTVVQADMQLPSKIWTLPLMFIGGAPGSIAGGVKVTTAVLVIVNAFRGIDSKQELRIGHRRIGRATLANAASFVTKAILLVFISVIFLSIAEMGRAYQPSFLELLFETVSAFGTVGLSLGITGDLSTWGKLLIICTMFAGRVGLVSMAMKRPGRYVERHVDMPEGDVLIG